MWLISGWQSGNWEESLIRDVLPKLKTIEPETSPGFSSSTAGDFKEFVDPDGKLKIKYPNSWLTVENEGLLAASTPKEWQEKYGLKTLFLAQYFQTGKFAQLVIQSGVFDISAGEIIKEMEKNNQKQGLIMEIVELDTKDNKTIFEARYLTAGSPNLYSKEEILVSGEKAYLIALIALEKDWPELAEEFNFILNSARVVQ